ncbi:IclR family transcriptional regulator [Rhizobium binxianense]
MPLAEDTKSLSPAVERAIRLLKLLESKPMHRFALSEISRALKIPKSTALNICAVLVDGQLVRRTEDGYKLGRRLVQLGSAYVNSVDLVREFYDLCRKVPEDLDAMIQMAVLDEELNAVYLARQDLNSGLRLGLRQEIGRRVPANCTGIGKALLAALPSAELERRLIGVRTLPTLTDKSISSPAQLRERLEKIRQAGHALDNEEVLPGVSCVACAAHTSHREDGLVGISITARTETMTPERWDRNRELVLSMMKTFQEQL